PAANTDATRTRHPDPSTGVQMCLKGRDSDANDSRGHIMDDTPLARVNGACYNRSMSDWINQFKPVIAEIERRAYQRGWDDAVAHIVAAAKRPTQAAPELCLS